MGRLGLLLPLAILLSLAPAAQALSFSADPTPDLPVLEAWGLRDPMRIGDMEAEAGLSLGIDREVTYLTAVGDVDGDGFDDLLAQHVDLETGVSVYTALAGPGLDEVLWSRTPTAGTALDLIGDLDADGLPDTMIAQSLYGEAASAGQEAGALAIEQAQTSGALLFEAAASGSGAAMLDVVMSAGVETSSAGAIDFLRAQGERTVRTGGTLVATGQNALMQVQEEVQTTQAGLLDALPIQNLTSAEVDATIRLLDLAGTVRGELALDDPGIDPRLLASPDLDLDGLPDAVLMQVQKANPTEEIATVVPTVTAFAGADASLDWEVTMDPLAGFPILVPDLGDLDGDGTVDLAYHAVATAGQAPQTVMKILSGADGSVLASIESTGLTAVVPFGLDASGQAKAILMEGDLESITSVSLVGSDLEAVWSLDLEPGTFPLNTLADPFTERLSGFTDWTGDGVPDLAVATAATVDAVEASAEFGAGTDGFDVTLISGVDGTEVWSGTFDAVLGAAPLPDLTGGPGAALAVVTGAAGQVENGLSALEGATLTVLDAATGSIFWELPLVAQEALSALPEAALHATVEAAGDLDGDGVEDLIAHVEILPDAVDVSLVETVGGHLVAEAKGAISQAYVISGATGETLHAEAEVSAQASASVMDQFPLELGEPEPGEAYVAQSVAQEAQDAPAPGLLVLLAGVVVAAWVRRR